MTDKILRVRDLEDAVDVSERTVRRMEGAGKFPKRIQITHGTIGWRASEVEAWIADRIAATEA